MGLFKRSMAVTSINFNCWRRDFRVKFILLFTALIVFNTLKPVLQYGDFNRNTENVLSYWAYFVTL